MRPPVKKNRAGIEKDLIRAMRGILGSGVTVEALTNPSALTLDEIIPDLNLYERLGVAFVAIGALYGYKDKPRGYEFIE